MQWPTAIIVQNNLLDSTEGTAIIIIFMWRKSNDCNEIQTHNHLVCKQTLNHLAI